MRSTPLRLFRAAATRESPGTCTQHPHSEPAPICHRAFSCNWDRAGGVSQNPGPLAAYFG